MAGGPSKGRRPREVEREESRLRAIINHVADGIVIIDRAGLIRFINPAAEVLLGRSADSLIDQPFGLPVGADEAVEIDVLGRDAPPVLAELRVTGMEWEGEPAYLVSIRDITDRQKTEERTRELALEQVARNRAEAEERRSRFLAEASRALESTLEVDRLLESLARLMVTPEAEVGVRPSDGRGLPQMADLCLIDLVERDGRVRRVAVAHHDASRLDLALALREKYPPAASRPYLGATVLRTGEPALYRELTEEVIRRSTHDAEHAKLMRELGIRSTIVAPLETPREQLGTVILGCESRSYDESDLALAVEVSQRAAMSIANARLYEDAHAASRAKSDFLAVMSHELRTPLNAIMGYTDLLVEQVAGPLERAQLEYLERIATGSRHLLDIVEEILTYARVEAGREQTRTESVRIADLVTESAEIIRPLAERKGLGYQISVDDRVGSVQTDPARLRQILLNLLSNAVKFTESGEVEVRLAAASPDRYTIVVRDTGCGIPDEHLDRIFEPFWQVEQSARRTAGGTGLGLSVAKRLAEMLGGVLRVESREGQGSTFSLELPVGSGPPLGREEKAAMPTEPQNMERLQPPDVGASPRDRESGRRKLTDREHA